MKSAANGYRRVWACCCAALALVFSTGCPLFIPVPIPNRAPTVNAGNDTTAVGGSEVVLPGSATDPDGDPLQFQWTQSGGQNVSLTGANTATVRFDAPNTLLPIQLTFRLTATDARGASAADDLVVTVVP